MLRTGEYDPIKDIAAVDEIGWIDIAEAVKNGYVPGAVEVEQIEYNDIDDPNGIMRYASDQFELYRQGDYIKSFAGNDTTAEPEVQTE